MNRLGLNESDFNTLYTELKLYTNNISVMTHFAESESNNIIFTNKQIKNFYNSISNKNFVNISSFNSGACVTKLIEDKVSNTIRVGLSLYGISTVDNKNRLLNLKPAMSIYSKVISINKVDSNNYIGYNRRYKTNTYKKIAIVSFGYGDGYPQFAPDGVPVVINNKIYTTVGKVSMDMLAIDISKSTDINIGDIVTIFDDKNITLENVANTIKVSPYYILTSVTNRVQRNYE